jgi:hypothetical protein
MRYIAKKPDRNGKGLAGQLRRAGEVLRHEGAGALYFKILGETVYRRMIFLARPLNGEAGEDVPGFGYRRLQAEEVESYLELRPDHVRGRVLELLEQGSVCHCAWKEERLAATLWTSPRSAEIGYLGCRIAMPDDQVYAHGLYKRPEEPAKGLPQMLTQRADEYHFGLGKRWKTSALMPENRYGGAYVKSVGYERIGLIGRYGIGGAWKYFLKRESENFRYPCFQ